MVSIIKISIVIVLLVNLTTSCTNLSQGVFLDENRGAIATTNDYFGDTVSSIVYPDQNWDESDSLWFYNTTQGSNLMYFDIFINLQQAQGAELFRENNNILKYRYLIQNPTWDNKFGLPVGWVENSYAGEDYIGFTCAACHTTQINYKNKGIRIDGGPAMADMETMLMDLEDALKASLTGQKFDKLAKKVLASDFNDKKERTAFYKRLVSDYNNIRNYNRMNRPTHIINGREVNVHYGYARLDAFGRIYNRVMSHIISEKEFQPNPANAPVSFPFLWDTPQHDFVQWNGVGDNGSALGLGPLGRNTGEVLGVFATFEVKESEPGDYSYPSSADSMNQVRLENHIKNLWSPSWRQLASKGVLPKINENLAAKGKKVFEYYKCQLCHQIIDRKAGQPVIAQFASVELIGTDPAMASNAMSYCGKSGILKNSNLGMCANNDGNGNLVAVLPTLSTVTGGVMAEGLLRKIGVYIFAILDNPLGSDNHSQRHIDLEVADRGFLNVYKGRPLNGIWATAPYLHNGSVRNLYELFLPRCSDAQIKGGKKCRANRFTVGNREFDTKNVGFVKVKSYKSSKQKLFLFDTNLKSNSNKGHEYAVGITAMPLLDAQGNVKRDANGKIQIQRFTPINEQQRQALVEYLKTL